MPPIEPIIYTALHILPHEFPVLNPGETPEVRCLNQLRMRITRWPATLELPDFIRFRQLNGPLNVTTPVTGTFETAPGSGVWTLTTGNSFIPSLPPGEILITAGNVANGIESNDMPAILT